MTKSFFSALAFLCLSVPVLRADQILTISVDTSALSGTTGSIDLAFDSGALSSQSATARVFNLTGVTFGGTQVQTGAASGGPVTLPITIGNSSAFQSNDDFESVLFTKLLTFTVQFSGPAVNSPTGLATSTSQFGLFFYSNTSGTVPALMSFPSGLVGSITVNADGSLTSAAISPNVSFGSVPEPATLWLSGGVLSLFCIRRFRSGNQ